MTLNIHVERLKKIRPFINFNFNITNIKKGELSDYDKRKIKKYYDILDDKLKSNNYIYRPRRKDRLKSAREFTNTPNLQGFKDLVIINNENGEKKPKIKFNKQGKMTVENDFITQHSYIWDRDNLMNDPENEIQNAIDALPAETKQYSFQVGEFENYKWVNQYALKDSVNAFLERYKNNKVEQWFNGIYGYTYKNQMDWVRQKEGKEDVRTKRTKISKRDYRRKQAIRDNEIRIKASTTIVDIMRFKKANERLKKLLGK